MYVYVYNKISGETNFIFKMQNKFRKIRYSFWKDVEGDGRILIWATAWQGPSKASPV